MNLPFSILRYEVLGLLFDLRLILLVVIFGVLLGTLFKEKVAKGVVVWLSVFIIFGQFALIMFYAQRGEPLDHEFFRRNFSEVFFVAQTSTISYYYFLVPLTFVLAFLWGIPKVKIALNS